MAHEPKLMRVKGNNCHLQWPVPPFSEEHRSRGGEGYIVDIAHPLECGYDEPDLNKDGIQRLDNYGSPLKRHVTGWCEGQLHKLEEAPDAKAATPINLPQARAVLLAWEEAQKPRKTEEPAPVPTAVLKAEGEGRKNREPVEVIEGG